MNVPPAALLAVWSIERSSTPLPAIGRLPDHHAAGFCDARQLGMYSPGEIMTVHGHGPLLIEVTRTICVCPRPGRPCPPPPAWLHTFTLWHTHSAPWSSVSS